MFRVLQVNILGFFSFLWLKIHRENFSLVPGFKSNFLYSFQDFFYSTWKMREFSFHVPDFVRSVWDFPGDFATRIFSIVEFCLNIHLHSNPIFCSIVYSLIYSILNSQIMRLKVGDNLQQNNTFLFIENKWNELNSKRIFEISSWYFMKIKIFKYSNIFFLKLSLRISQHFTSSVLKEVQSSTNEHIELQLCSISVRLPPAMIFWESETSLKEN